MPNYSFGKIYRINDNNKLKNIILKIERIYWKTINLEKNLDKIKCKSKVKKNIFVIVAEFILIQINHNIIKHHYILILQI